MTKTEFKALNKMLTSGRPSFDSKRFLRAITNTLCMTPEIERQLDRQYLDDVKPDQDTELVN